MRSLSLNRFSSSLCLSQSFIPFFLFFLFLFFLLSSSPSLSSAHKHIHPHQIEYPKLRAYLFLLLSSLLFFFFQSLIHSFFFFLFFSIHLFIPSTSTSTPTSTSTSTCLAHLRIVAHESHTKGFPAMNPNLNESSLATATTTSTTSPNTTPYTLPPPANPPNSAPTTSTRTRTPHPASIRHSQSFEPQQSSTWPRSEGGLATKRSSASLNLLSFSSPQGSLEQDPRSSILPVRSSGFSNPFKKLQSTFGNSKKSLEFGNNNNVNNYSNYVVNGNGNNNTNNNNTNNNNVAKVVSSSSSANSLTSSWRSKGAEMLSKANWRPRKSTLYIAPVFYISLSFFLLRSFAPQLSKGERVEEEKRRRREKAIEVS